MKFQPKLLMDDQAVHVVCVEVGTHLFACAHRTQRIRRAMNLWEWVLFADASESLQGNALDVVMS